METAAAYTAAVTGIEGRLVKVEADVSYDLPATVLIGLPATALREARDRVRAAIINSDERWPDAKITVSLLPATLPKRGSAYDLAIAVAVLAANGDLAAIPEETAFLAELGLDGRLRPVHDVLPAALALAHAGITTMVVAAANYAEADQVAGMTVVGAESLAEVIAWLRGGPPPHAEPPLRGGDDGSAPSRPQPDLTEVFGQPDARRALEVCAAGAQTCRCSARLGPARSCWPNGSRRSCRRWTRRPRWR